VVPISLAMSLGRIRGLGLICWAFRGTTVHRPAAEAFMLVRQVI
jgi:hypothetical protein